ncbi:Jasmonate O-methyltransferase [Citrus sinensis]|nr:Jasmonate O-methyltransferase [Citrus sinensis]
MSQSGSSIAGVPPALESNATPAALNKGKIYISKSSPQCVLDAYSLQFQNNFLIFLKSRAAEMIAGGRMVLSLMGRRSIDPTTEESCYQWELLAQALMSLVTERLIEEEKLDSFNAPYYAPCPEELKMSIQKEGSFIIDRLGHFEIDWDGGVEELTNTTLLPLSRGQRVAKTVRAVVESMFELHFGKGIMDLLFARYAEMVDDYLSKNRAKYINLVISIIKKDN